MVWLPAPCAPEIPELPENPEPPVAVEPEPFAAPEDADEPVDVPPEEPLFCAAALPVEPPEPLLPVWDEPGSAYATTPAEARPAAPTATVTARSRDRPRCRAAVAAATGHTAPRGALLSRPCPG